MKNKLSIILVFLTINSFSQEFAYKEKKELVGYQDYIMDAGFSPFRKYFAITIGNNTMEIYNKDWEKIFSHQGNPKSVGGHLAFSPDEKYLAYAKYKSDNDIAIIKLDEQKVVQVLTGHANNINKIEFSHNGKYLASVSSDKSACLWEWNNDELVLKQKFNYEDAVMGVSFSFNDNYLVVGGYDKKIYLYKFDNHRFQLFDTVPDLKYWLYDLAFHPAKNEFVTSSQYEIRRYKIGKKVEFSDSIKLRVNRSVNYNSTGEYLVLGKNQDVVLLKMKESHMEEYEHIYRHSDYVFGGTFSDDGMFLTSFSSDRSCIVWELTGVKPSKKSLISDYMEGELTSVQKKVLTAEVINEILSKLDKKLTAPRDEFETTIQFNTRRQKLKAEVLSYLQSYTEKQYQLRSKSGNKIQIPLERLVGYNADLQIYKVHFLETDAGVKIPVEDAKLLKKNWEKSYIQVSKIKSDDGISFNYSDFELIHPINGKTYPVNPLENPFQIEKKSRNIEHATDRTENKKTNETYNASGEEMYGTDRAIIFATNIYDSFSELVNPVIDATTIAEELQSNYYVQTELIVNPSLKEIIEKIREYAKLTYSPKDNLLVFFAGHGIYDEVFKEGYVISRDSKSDDVAKTSYLSHSNLRTMINNIPCNHILLVMDVCFGGTFDPLIASKSRAADMYAEVTNEEYIDRKKKYKTRLYLTSGGKEYVPDGRPGHHSPFARKFLESLRNYGGSDGILTVNEIIQYVEKVDPQPRFGEFGDNEPGSDFILLVK
jgi:hypothetical protein